MIRTLRRYLTEESFPRWKGILWSSTPWLATAGAWSASQCLMSADKCLIAHAFLNACLTYSSIAFGFCVTGITMCLAIADQSFVRKLVQRFANGSKHNTYSDLIFIFTWTAAAHILLIAVSILALFSFGSDERLFASSYHWAKTGLAGLSVGLLLYALMQFLTTVLTLSSVAKIYIDHLVKAAPLTKPSGKRNK
jgi:hypothetical protein